MSTKIGSLAVSLSLDAENWNGSMAQVDRSLRTMGSELRATKAMGTDYGNSLDGLRSKKDILTRSVEASTIKLSEERKKYDELVASGKASEAQLERQAKKVNDAQVQFNRLSTELNEVDQALKTQSSTWTQLGDSLTAAGTKMKSVGDGMKNIGREMTMKVTAPLVALGTGAFKAAVDFESAFAGVRKTVDASESEFQHLSDGIRDMAKELPTAASDIAAVAESAGQLGIKNESILGFTRTIIDLGEATNLSLEQASTEFARFANIVGMSQDDFDRLGSSVVSIGNSMATTESEIVSMGMRLAAQGSLVGMTEAQIMALAATMSSLGIEAEAGGTAMTMVLKKIDKAVGEGGKSVAGIAKAARVSSKEFSEAWKNDPVMALDMFIKGLGASAEEGKNLTSILDDLGIKGIRESDTILRMAGASDLLADAVSNSSNAWKENTALTEEAEERYKTTASQMKIMWNRIVDIGISIGGILIPKVTALMDRIDPLIDRFANMSSESQNMIIGIAGIAAAIGPVLLVGGSLLSGLGGLVTVAGAASTALGVGGVGLGATLAGLAGPVAIAVAAVAGISAAGYGLYKVLNETSIPEIEIFGDKVSESTQQAVGAFMELNDEATVQLNQLKWSGMTVTQEMADGMVDTYGQMGGMVLEEMKTDHESQLQTLREHLANSKYITEEEQQVLLESVIESQEKREAEIELSQARIETILSTAVEERRGLNGEEQTEYENHLQLMQETAIQHLTESEEEQLIILERLKVESDKINAEQAIETAARAKEAREAVVEEAEKKYEETLAALALLKEDGTIESEELYKKLVEDARKTRDESVSAADEMYESVIGIAKEKGDEYVSETEIRLGRVMTTFEKMAYDVVLNATRMSVGVRNTLVEMAVEGASRFEDLKTKGITAVGNLVTGINFVKNDIPTIIRGALQDAAVEAAKSAINFYNAGVDVVQGLIRGITSKIADVKKVASGLGTVITTAARTALETRSPSRVFMAIGNDVVRGLEIGMSERQKKLENVMTDLTLSLKDITDHYKSEEVKINKNANSEIVKIEKRSKEDVDKIYRAANAKKRKTTHDENVRIRRIQEDAAKKIAEIERKSMAESVKLLDETSKEKLKEIKLFIDDKNSLEQLSLIEEAAIWEESVKLFEDSTKEKVEAQKAYKKAVEAIQKEIESVNKEHLDRIQKINDDHAKSVKELNDEYNNAYSSRVSSIMNFAGVFDEFVDKFDGSGDTLMWNLESQVEALEEWREVLASLWTKIDDQALMEELEGMGVSALGQLQALNGMTDEGLDQFVGLYNQKFALAREQATDELSTLKEDTEYRIEELRETANAELDKVHEDWMKKMESLTGATDDQLKTLKTVGRDAGQGLLDGLASMEPALVAKARSIAEAIKREMARVLEIASPSKATFRMGAWVGQGLEDGIQSKLQDVANTANELARAVIPNIPEHAMSDGHSGTTKMTDNSKSMTNYVTIQTNDSNAVNDTERALRRLAFQF